MHCPYCSHADTQVLDTRISEDGASIRRRRRCASCDKRFTTYERAEVALPAVVKKNGSRADFDRSKLSFSLHLALRKRPVSAEAVQAAIERIEEKLMSSGDKEVPSERVGELVMRELRKIDKIAYVRFASVYRSFEDVDEFADVIREVAAKKTGRETGRETGHETGHETGRGTGRGTDSGTDGRSGPGDEHPSARLKPPRK